MRNLTARSCADTLYILRCMTKEQQIVQWVPVADIVEHGGMALEGDDNESDGLIDPYNGD